MLQKPRPFNKVVNAFMLVVAANLLLSGCGASSSSTSSVPTLDVQGTRQADNLRFDVSSHQLNAVGSSVPIQFTLKYTGTQPLRVATATPFMDVKISHGNIVVWQYSKAYGFTEGGVIKDLPYGYTQAEDVMWDQKDLQGNQVPKDTYTVKAWYNPQSVGSRPGTTNEADYYSEPITIKIQ